MDQKIGIIITSHGEYCLGAVDSLNMIIGRSEHIQTVSVTPTLSVQDVEKKMNQAYETLCANCKEIIIFTDLICGTPNNVAVKLMMQKNNITVITGYNLAILIELINKRNCGRDDVSELLDGEEEIFQNSNRILKKEGA